VRCGIRGEGVGRVSVHWETESHLQLVAGATATGVTELVIFFLFVVSSDKSYPLLEAIVRCYGECINGVVVNS
jgi:hypothetical protein